MNLTAKNEAINYNKTPYIDIKRRNGIMSNTAIRETLISLGRNLGGKKLSKATVILESIAPDCSFEIENARFVPRLSCLLIMDYEASREGLRIPSSDIKTLYYRQHDKNHVINICDYEGNHTVVDLWVA